MAQVFNIGLACDGLKLMGCVLSASACVRYVRTRTHRGARCSALQHVPARGKCVDMRALLQVPAHTIPRRVFLKVIPKYYLLV